jgi:UDP-N-acetylmuramate dehydrogenase
VNIRKDAPLSDVLWYRIGGTARYLIDASSPEDVQDAITFVRQRGIEPVLFVGHGANLLFPDEYFAGAVVRLVDPSPGEVAPIDTGARIGDDVLIESFAGETLDRLLHRAFAAHLVGLEWAGGLPGTVGAGVRGNVGAFGGEIRDSVHQVTVLDLAENPARVRTLRGDQLEFVYRGSLLKQDRNLIALSATFRLRKGSASEVEAARDTYDAHIAYRQTHHPMDFPNTGSTFKNVSRAEDVEKVLAVYPELRERVARDWHGKVSMGYLNRKLGFAGFRAGNAAVSDKHCNFVLNLGGARAADVVEVVETIRQTFEDTFGFQPEPEVEIVRVSRPGAPSHPQPAGAPEGVRRS